MGFKNISIDYRSFYNLEIHSFVKDCIPSGLLRTSLDNAGITIRTID